MKKRLLFTFCFCFLFSGLLGQLLPNNYFMNPTNQSCIHGTSHYEGFDEWLGYQTTDSNYWGPHDPHCFDIAVPATSGMRLDMANLNPDLPVYIVSKLDSITHVQLDSNALYRVAVYVNAIGGNLQAILGTACPDGICNGVQIGIEIPDSFGTGTDIRWYPASGGFGFPNNSMGAEFCFSSERFPMGNFIRHAYIKLSPDGPNTGVTLLCNAFELEDMTPWTEKVRQIDAPFNGSAYEYFFSAWTGVNCFMGCSNKLMMYTAPTYPSPNHLSYVEVSPSPNVATQETVDVVIDFDASLHFQPFTQLRGGLVLGDTLRHNVNLINNGGVICTYAFIDLIFNNGDDYTHRSGQVKFEGSNACMQFGKGSTLRVDQNAQMVYGRPSHGMLALRSDGKIVLEKGAAFILQNTFAFGEYHGEAAPQQFEVHLKPGSKFTFGPESHLTNGLSRFPQSTFLDVYMEGGTLDDSALSAAEKALIHRIYLSPSAAFAYNLKILGNPFSENVELTFVASAKMSVRFDLLSMDGKTVVSQDQNAAHGANYFQIPTGTLPSGAYLLRATTPYASCSKRLLKTE